MNNVVTKNKEYRGGVILNLACTVGEHIISGLVAFLLTPYLIKRLGMELYGLYPIVLEFSAIFGIAFGVVNSTSGKYIAIEAEKGRELDASRYFSSAFYSNLALSVLLSLPMLMLAFFAGRFLEIPDGHVAGIRTFMMLSFASVIVDAVTNAFVSVYFITNRLELRAVAGLSGVGAKAATLLALFYFFKPSLVSVGVALLLSSAVIGAVNVMMFIKHSRHIELSFRLVSLAYVKRLTASGFFYSANRIASVLVSGGFLVVANILLAPSLSGEYSVAYTFINAVCGILMTVAGVFVPMNSKHFARGEGNRLHDGLLRDEKILGFVSAAIFSVSVALGQSFFSLWLGGAATKSLVSVAFILLVPVLSMSCALPIVNVGMIMNRTRKLSLLFLCGGFLSLALGVFVASITNFGGVGIAVVSAVSQIVWYSVAVPCFAGRAFSRSPKAFFVPILKTYLAAVVSLAASLVLCSVCTVRNWLEFLIVGSSVAAISFCLSFFVVFKDFRDFYKG